MSITGYSWEDLDMAPNGPGLYSWYLDPVLRPADLTDAKSTKENLLRFAEQLKLPTFDVQASGHLSLLFQGNLDHIHLGEDSSRGLSSLVEFVLQDETKRALFAKMLGESAPHLMAPLYIGVAVDIRERLRQHKNDIDNFRSIQKKGLGSDLLEDTGHKFALEIVSRGIPSRRLRVFVSEFCEKNVTKEEIRNIAEAVETILNRLFYPIMGRR